MDNLFNPSSIAVIGASTDEDKIAGRPIKYLQKHGYAGEIFPVNPNHQQVAGLSAYPDIAAVPESPDLVLVLLPSTFVLDAVEECLETGVKNILIVSSGFSETQTDDGIKAEETLAAWAKEYEANIVGPNSQGVVNFRRGIGASFTPSLEREELIPGPVSFITQSGAFGGALTTIFQENGIGLSKMIATGNEASVGSLDVIKYLASDPDTEIVSGYIEGFNDGRKLLELKRTEAGIRLPIVLLKVGESERAHEAAASHTGTMAGRYDIYRAIFDELGVIDVDSINRFFTVIEALTTLSELPKNRLGVVSTSGGAGVHIADAAEREGLTLPTPSEETFEGVKQYLPSYGSAINPVDLTAQTDVDDTAAILELLFEDDNIDSVLFQITNITGERGVTYAKTVTEVAAQYDKPLFVCWTGGVSNDQGLSVYEKEGVPVFESPINAVGTIADISSFAESIPHLEAASDLSARVEEQPRVDSSPDNPPSTLTEIEGKRLLREYNIPTAEEISITSPEEAAKAATEIGFPTVAKLVAPSLPHRNSVNGARMNLQDASSNRNAARELFELADELEIDGPRVTIQPQIEGETELALGIITDSDFGPVVMFGRGGTLIEEIDDMTFRTIPTTEEHARSMFDDLETIEASQFTKAQRDSIVEAILSLSELYLENQWIEEADVNPIIVTKERITAVDALFLGPD